VQESIDAVTKEGASVIRKLNSKPRGSGHSSRVRDRIRGMQHSRFFRIETVVETSSIATKVNAWDEPCMT